VGYSSPGFGSIESMSSQTIIDDINRSKADLLVISLGAKKGHQWIAHNESRIEIPVISHLGAAVNFIAGNVKRAPAWMQHAGFEWTWRIYQEPKLLQRYWNDGKFFLQAINRLPPLAPDSRSDLHNAARQMLITAQQAAGPEKVVDIGALDAIDARTLGMFYAFRFRTGPDQRHRIICSSPRMSEMLRSHMALCLLSDPA
jgi:hypothetical protein